MSLLITAILVLIVLALVIWLVQMLPIDAKLRQIIIVLLVIVAILWFLMKLGLI